MLTISANNHNLIIPNSIRVAITVINSMLVRSRGSNSLNFGLPGTNRKFLEAPHLSGKKRLSELDSTISFRSYKKSAKLLFETLSKEQYSCRINIDESNFYEQYKDKSIRELLLGGARDYSDYVTNPSLFHKNSDEADFTICKLPNESFMNGTMHEADYVANNKHQNNQDYTPFFDTKTPRTPFIYLCYLYEQLFHEHGYTVRYNHLRKDSHFKKLVLYTNQSATDAGTDFYLAKHLPDITIVDLINAISDMFNVHPQINETTKEVFLVSLEQKIKTKKIIDITQYASDDLTKASEDLATKVQFKINVDTSDENQNPHKYLQEQLGLNIKAAVNEFADLPADEAGAIRLVTAENMYYRYEADTSGVYAWQKYTINIQVAEYGEGDPVHEIESAFSAVQIRSGTTHIFPNVVNMQGNTVFRNGDQKIPLMLGFFHDKNFTFGVWNNSDESSEIFLTPDSLFEHCFKNTANMLVNSYQPYECTLRLPPSVLNTFDFSAIYQIRDTFYFVEELNYNLEAEDITYEKAKLRAL